jgi:hypothetical protein
MSTSLGERNHQVMKPSMILLVSFGAGHSPFYRLKNARPAESGMCRRTGTFTSVFALPELTTEFLYTLYRRRAANLGRPCHEPGMADLMTRADAIHNLSSQVTTSDDSGTIAAVGLLLGHRKSKDCRRGFLATPTTHFTPPSVNAAHGLSAKSVGWLPK